MPCDAPVMTATLLSLLMFVSFILLYSGAELTDVVSQPIFDVARLVQATLQQRADSSLGRGTLNGGHACVPLGRDFCVGMQACDIYEILRLHDRLFVARSDAHRQRLNTRF